MAKESSPARLRSQSRVVHQHSPERIVTREQQLAAALPKKDRARVIEDHRRNVHLAACEAMYAAAVRSS